MAGVGSAAFVVPTSETGSAIPLREVFVSVDLDANVAHVVCESGTGLRWKEVPISDAVLLAALGARTHVGLPAQRSVRSVSAPSIDCGA